MITQINQNYVKQCFSIIILVMQIQSCLVFFFNIPIRQKVS